ncbi:MAG TPA: signal peptidase I [Gemmatimonadales bacterium]|nr:signal peptidase I [Gemmatimonadales bacterium]
MAASRERVVPRPAETTEPVPQAPPPSRRSRQWEFVRSLLVAVAIFLVLRTFLIEAFRIPSGSMENTLLIGDFLFVNKALYGAEIPFTGVRLPAFREPRRNDLVIFKSVEEPRLTVVKRLVGMPGDTLRMEDNRLFVNGGQADEPFVIRTDPLRDHEEPKMRAWQTRYLTADRDAASYRPTLKNWGPIVVPPDSFFVMGDNRDNSYDSRYWGFLGRDRIRGRPLIIYYSFDPNGVLPLPLVTAPRWRRIFSLPR